MVGPGAGRCPWSWTRAGRVGLAGARGVAVATPRTSGASGGSWIHRSVGSRGVAVGAGVGSSVGRGGPRWGRGSGDGGCTWSLSRGVAGTPGRGHPTPSYSSARRSARRCVAMRVGYPLYWEGGRKRVLNCAGRGRGVCAQNHRVRGSLGLRGPHHHPGPGGESNRARGHWPVRPRPTQALLVVVGLRGWWGCG